MPKSCALCGAPLPVQTGRGRRRTKCATCSPSRSKKPTAKPTPLPSVSATVGLVESVRADLLAAGVEASPAGQAALLLADRIENHDNSGSAVAQMVRQLHASLAIALAAEDPAVVDPVEEFRGRLRSV